AASMGNKTRSPVEGGEDQSDAGSRVGDRQGLDAGRVYFKLDASSRTQGRSLLLLTQWQVSQAGLREATSGHLVTHRSVDELDFDSLVNHLGERLGIPIGEAHAAVRFRLADVLRVWRAVDAVVIAEIDPGTANRIFGTSRDGERLFRLHPLELELWAVVIGGILGDRANGAGPAGSGPLLAADRCGVEVDQLAAAVQGADRSCRFVHHHLCDLCL